MIGTPPPLHHDWRGHWLTPYEFAAAIQRPYGTVRRWCSDGMLQAVGIRCIRTSHRVSRLPDGRIAGTSSAWWILYL